MKKIFLILIFLVCLNANKQANAQYNRYCKFTDVRETIINDLIFKKINNKDVEAIKNNKVRKLTLTDESGDTLQKMTFNRMGLLTDYATYEYNNGSEIMYSLAWNDTRLLKVKYSESGMDINYDFNYNETYMDFIHAEFAFGLGEDYIFHYASVNGENLVSKILYRDKSKDTVYMTILFNYDNKGKLASTREEKFGYPYPPIDTIYYEKNSVIIEHVNFKKQKFTEENHRIIEEKTTFFTKEHLPYASKTHVIEKDIVSTIKYFHKENGLIDYAETSNGNIEGKINYEYGFYEN